MNLLIFRGWYCRYTFVSGFFRGRELYDLVTRNDSVGNSWGFVVVFKAADVKRVRLVCVLHSNSKKHCLNRQFEDLALLVVVVVTAKAGRIEKETACVCNLGVFSLVPMSLIESEGGRSGKMKGRIYSNESIYSPKVIKPFSNDLNKYNC